MVLSESAPYGGRCFLSSTSVRTRSREVGLFRQRSDLEHSGRRDCRAAALGDSTGRAAGPGVVGLPGAAAPKGDPLCEPHQLHNATAESPAAVPWTKNMRSQARTGLAAHGGTVAGGSARSGGHPAERRNGGSAKHGRTTSHPAQPGRHGCAGGVHPHKGQADASAPGMLPSPPLLSRQYSQQQHSQQQYSPQLQQQSRNEQSQLHYPALQQHRSYGGQSGRELSFLQRHGDAPLQQGGSCQVPYAQQHALDLHGHGDGQSQPQRSAFAMAGGARDRGCTGDDGGSYGAPSLQVSSTLHTSASLKKAGSGKAAGGRGSKPPARKRTLNGSSIAQSPRQQPKKQRKVDYSAFADIAPTISVLVGVLRQVWRPLLHGWFSLQAPDTSKAQGTVRIVLRRP